MLAHNYAGKIMLYAIIVHVRKQWIPHQGPFVIFQMDLGGRLLSLS